MVVTVPPVSLSRDPQCRSRKCPRAPTFPFFSIAQGGRDGELSLLSDTHPLQALVPAFESFQDAQGKPNGLPVVMLVATTEGS